MRNLFGLCSENDRHPMQQVVVSAGLSYIPQTVDFQV